MGGNKEKQEYHSLYKTALTIFVKGQIQIKSNESKPDYYKRVVIPIHAAVVAKSDLETVVKAALPIAFAYGLELRGNMEGVDSLKITKDLISHLGKDEDSRRMAFRYTINTMKLYENSPSNDSRIVVAPPGEHRLSDNVFTNTLPYVTGTGSRSCSSSTTGTRL